MYSCFPDFDIIPAYRDGELVTISNYAHCCDESCFCKSSIGSKDLSCSAVTFKLRKGLYHERYSDIVKVLCTVTLYLFIM